MAQKRLEGESGDRGTVSVGSRRSNRRRNDRTADSVHIADDRRRDLLRYLAVGSPATVSEAARQIAAWDRKVAPAEVGDEQRDRVRDHLLRNHVPRLRACGLVTYDEATETLRLTDCGRRAVTK
jgi:hypothetical protein